jgi:GDP-4-dehydro-6-deoxy-D-mannose reductase
MAVIRRALITGMSGFLGLHLAAVLKAASLEAVCGLDDTMLRMHDRVDICDGAAVRSIIERTRPDAVFHLAGRIKASEPDSFYETNLLGTVTLLESIRTSGLRPRVIFASSSAVYGDGGPAPISEDQAVNPITHYGASKAAAEIVVRRFVSAAGGDAVVARIFNVVGPGQRTPLVASELARQVALSERNMVEAAPMRVRRLGAVRDFVDVRDVATALLAIAERGRPGGTFNVCSGRGASIRYCLDALIAAARTRLTYEETEHIDSEPEVLHQIGDKARIERKVQWSPTISLEQSLTDLLEDWRHRTSELSHELER